MASIYRLHDRNFDVIDKLLIYGKDFTENHIEDVLEDGDSTITLEFLGGCIPEEIEVEGYIETDKQIYVIKEVSGTTVVGKLNLEDLEAYTVQSFVAANQQSIISVAEAALDGTGWTVQSTIDTTKARNVQQFKKTPLELLYKIRDAWMCEIRFDTKNKVVKFADQFGFERGAYFIEGLNLKSIRRSVDGYDFYTRIYPIGKDGLTIASINDGIPYLENHQYSDKNIMLTWEDTNYEDPYTLLEDAQAKLADLSIPKVAYSAEVRDLQQINKYNLHTLEDELNVTLQDELGLDLEDQGEFSVFALGLGDTVRIISKTNRIKDKQRIVKIVSYPDDPERNTVEMANTVLTWEEQQAKLKAAAEAWDDVSNSDGTVNGVYVHGVQAGEVVGIEVVIDGVPTISNFNLSNIEINGTPSSLVSLLNQSAAEHEEETGPDVGLYKLRAKVIDVDDIFAQNITATGTISGARLEGAHIETESGNIGALKIDEDGLNYSATETPSETITNELTTHIQGASIEFERLQRNSSTGGRSTQKIDLAFDMISCEMTVVNSGGTVTYQTGSGMSPDAIYENGTYLSNKYAPKSGSDPILKKNIAKSSLNALELLKQIQLHEFDWKKDGLHWPVGFIAPELYDIDQNMAEPPNDEPGSYWSVNSFYMVGVLTKAVQELTQRIEDLERQVK